MLNKEAAEGAVHRCQAKTVHTCDIHKRVSCGPGPVQRSNNRPMTITRYIFKRPSMDPEFSYTDIHVDKPWMNENDDEGVDKLRCQVCTFYDVYVSL